MTISVLLAFHFTAPILRLTGQKAQFSQYALDL